MQETKYQELKKENQELAKRMMGQHRLAQSSLVLLKNIDARIEAIKDLIIEKGLFTDQEYQDAVDVKLGLRKKLDNETIELADVAWVSYEAEVEGVPEKQKEECLPVRVGSNAVMFESALIGQQCDAKGIVFEGSWKEENPSEPLKPIERKVVFTIDVLRVKTRRTNGAGNGITDDIDRADGVGSENSDIAMLESSVDAEGLGHADGVNDQAEHTQQ
jgi:hypothetical protein